jgi:hypothetical protein
MMMVKIMIADRLSEGLMMMIMKMSGQTIACSHYDNNYDKRTPSEGVNQEQARVTRQRFVLQFVSCALKKQKLRH